LLDFHDIFHQTFDTSAVPTPPTPPLRFAWTTSPNNPADCNQETHAEEEKEYQHQLWLYHQRLDSLVAKFDPRYDRIAAGS
jgi:hypothetical protein